MRSIITIYILLLFFVISCNKKPINIYEYTSFLQNLDSTNYTYQIYNGKNKDFYSFAKNLYIDDIISDTLYKGDTIYKYTINTFIVKKIGFRRYEFYSDRYKQDRNKLHVFLGQDSIFFKFANSEKGNVGSNYEVNIGYLIDRDLKILDVNDIKFKDYIFNNCLILRFTEGTEYYIDFWFHTEKGLIQYEIVRPEDYSVAFIEKDILFN